LRPQRYSVSNEPFRSGPATRLWRCPAQSPLLPADNLGLLERALRSRHSARSATGSARRVADQYGLFCQNLFRAQPHELVPLPSPAIQQNTPTLSPLTATAIPSLAPQVLRVPRRAARRSLRARSA